MIEMLCTIYTPAKSNTRFVAIFFSEPASVADAGNTEADPADPATGAVDLEGAVAECILARAEEVTSDNCAQPKDDKDAKLSGKDTESSLQDADEDISDAKAASLTESEPSRDDDNDIKAGPSDEVRTAAAGEDISADDEASQDDAEISRDADASQDDAEPIAQVSALLNIFFSRISIPIPTDPVMFCYKLWVHFFL